MALKKLRSAASFCVAESNRVLFEPSRKITLKEHPRASLPGWSERVIFSHFFAASTFFVSFFCQEKKEINRGRNDALINCDVQSLSAPQETSHDTSEQTSIN
jgi:hypothetical protein